MYSVVTTNTKGGSGTFCLVFSKVIFVQFCKVWNACETFLFSADTKLEFCPSWITTSIFVVGNNIQKDLDSDDTTPLKWKLSSVWSI